MRITRYLTLALVVVGLMGAGHVSAQDKMEKPEGMMMDGDNAVMENVMNEIPFSAMMFKEAKDGGQPFLVAFHKKGCPLCAAQKEALTKVYGDQMYKNLKVLVVDYSADTASLQQFNVGMQGTLILYKGQEEISRTEGLTKAADIKKQLQV